MFTPSSAPSSAGSSHTDTHADRNKTEGNDWTALVPLNIESCMCFDYVAVDFDNGVKHFAEQVLSFVKCIATAGANALSDRKYSR